MCPNHKKDDNCKNSGLTRRKFLHAVSGSFVGAAAAGSMIYHPPDASAGIKPGAEEYSGMQKISLDINGSRQRVLVEPRWTLLYVLREILELTGTKIGCDRGECGACTVLIDDTPRYACMMLALEARHKKITTLEGLLNKEKLGDVQQAFAREDGYQCGYCTPGQIMAAEGLLRKNPDPDPDEIRKGMSGNLCRCGAYIHIFKSVAHAAELKKRSGGNHG